jgi:hypothetical protein
MGEHPSMHRVSVSLWHLFLWHLSLVPPDSEICWSGATIMRVTRCRRVSYYPLGSIPAQLLWTRYYKCSLHTFGCPCTARLAAWIKQPEDGAVTDRDGNCKHDVHYVFECDTKHNHKAAQRGLGAGLKEAKKVGRMRVAAGVLRRIVNRFALPAAINVAAMAVGECEVQHVY